MAHVAVVESPTLERELAELRDVVSRAAAGLSGLAVIEGAAGIGKTRLLGEARRLADEAGLRVLFARGGELEESLAFGVARQLLHHALAGGEVLDACEAGAANDEEAVARELFATTQVVGEFSQNSSFAILHALYRLTVGLAAESPLVLAVDDLHWCDLPSARFLAYLGRRDQARVVATRDLELARK